MAGLIQHVSTEQLCSQKRHHRVRRGCSKQCIFLALKNTCSEWSGGISTWRGALRGCGWLCVYTGLFTVHRHQGGTGVLRADTGQGKPEMRRGQGSTGRSFRHSCAWALVTGSPWSPRWPRQGQLKNYWNTILEKLQKNCHYISSSAP